MKMNFDKPNTDKKIEETGIYGGIGSLEVSAFKGASVGQVQQKEITENNIELEKNRIDQRIDDFKEGILGDLNGRINVEGKIEFIDSQVNSLNGEIEDAKSRIIEDDNFEEGFLDKIFDNENNVKDGVNSSSTVRGVRDIFKLANEKINILNNIKSRLEFNAGKQRSEESDIREAA